MRRKLSKKHATFEDPSLKTSKISILSINKINILDFISGI